MGYLAVVIAATLIVFFMRLINRGMDRKQKILFDEKTTPFAQVRSLCMIHENYYEQPGAAQVLDGTLSLYTVLGDTIEMPLTQVELVKVRKNKFLLGRYPWWGKTGFWLETPKTSGLVLGVDDPAPWQNIFKNA